MLYSVSCYLIQEGQLPFIAQLLEAPVSIWINKKSEQRLTGRSLHCAKNAWNFLIRAENIAELHPTVAFFCATHAVEEAVASFISAAKSRGYESAKAINIRDHLHKAVVHEFARMVADDAGDARIAFTLKEDKDALYVRVAHDGVNKYHELWVGLISYNREHDNQDPANAESSFVSRFPSESEMVKKIRARADYRNNALYASNSGVPSMAKEKLALQLHQHAVVTLGLLWAAGDMSIREKDVSFIKQILEAAERVTLRLKKDHACSNGF